MLSADPDLFAKNCVYLARFSSDLVEKVKVSSSKLDWVVAQDGQGQDCLYDGSLLLSAVEASIASAAQKQYADPSRVLFQQLQATQSPQSVLELSHQLLDSETLVTVNQLEALQSTTAHNVKRSDISFNGSSLPKSVLLVGAFALVSLPAILEQVNLYSVALLEVDEIQLAAALFLVDLEELIALLKEKAIRFNLLFEPNLGSASGAKAKILDHFASTNPLAFHALALIQSPVLSADLVEAAAWLESPDGYLELVKGYLGNDTDEFNQVFHGVYLGLQSRQNHCKILSSTSQIKPIHSPCLLVASGPSLDQYLRAIHRQQDSLVVFAAGSALGSLLRAGISPTAVVLLEMSSIVYQDLLDLVSEGYDLSVIVAFVSATVDPRIASLFKSTVIFQRPLSSTLCLFPSEVDACLPQAGPQAANACLEVILELGYRNLLLVGCDFGTSDRSIPRAQQAMGLSPRVFNLPVSGALGKTIFSNAELSVTRQLFEHSLHLYGAKASLLGDGSRIQGATVVAGNVELALSQFHGDAQLFSNVVDNLCERIVDATRLRDLLVAAKQCNQQIVASCIERLDQSKGLDSEVMNHWNSLLSWRDHEAPVHEQLHRRLTRFLMFFVIQKLIFDDHSGKAWSEKIEPVKASLQQIHDLYNFYYKNLLDLCDMKHVPAWDSAWLRRRMLMRWHVEKA